LRREPFEETGSSERIRQALNKVFGPLESAVKPTGSPSGNGQPSLQEKRAANQASENTSTQQSRQSAAAKQTELPAVNGERPFKLDLNQINKNKKDKVRVPQRQRYEGSSAKSTLNNKRGRYSLSTIDSYHSNSIALDATLRALVNGGYRHGDGTVPSHALRYKRFSHKQGALFVFAIDASGSMAVARIGRAREVALGLLRQSYINRDSVAIVVFRGTRAELVLPPSRSMLRAKRALDGITVGGGTPVAAGILTSIEVAKRASDHHGRAVLLLFTDGQANVLLQSTHGADRESRDEMIGDELLRLGRELRQAKIPTIVIETGNKFTSHDRPQKLARQLGATLTRIP
jgi:magnesium chelatase subunit D